MNTYSDTNPIIILNLNWQNKYKKTQNQKYIKILIVLFSYQNEAVDPWKIVMKVVALLTPKRQTLPKSRTNWSHWTEMAVLCPGVQYGLSSQQNFGENKDLIFVKLTDSALRAIEDYIKNQVFFFYIFLSFHWVIQSVAFLEISRHIQMSY